MTNNTLLISSFTAVTAAPLVIDNQVITTVLQIVITVSTLVLEFYKNRKKK